MPWNIFKKELTEEQKETRKLQREAFVRGKAEAKKEKQRRKIAKAHQAGYKKEMEGRFAEFKAFGKSALNAGNKIVDECGKLAYGLEPPPKQKKKKRK